MMSHMNMPTQEQFISNMTALNPELGGIEGELQKLEKDLRMSVKSTYDSLEVQATEGRLLAATEQFANDILTKKMWDGQPRQPISEWILHNPVWLEDEACGHAYYEQCGELTHLEVETVETKQLFNPNPNNYDHPKYLKFFIEKMETTYRRESAWLK